MHYYSWITTIYAYFARHTLVFNPFVSRFSLHFLSSLFFPYSSSIVQSVGHLITPSVWPERRKKNQLKMLHRISILSNCDKKNYSRAIFTAWVVIVTTAIPVAIVHGVVNFPYNGRNYTACLFLVENGYNLMLFQVNVSSDFHIHFPFSHSHSQPETHSNIQQKRVHLNANHMELPIFFHLSPVCFLFFFR